MYRLNDLKPSLVKIIIPMSVIALAAVFACSSSEITIVNIDGDGTPTAESEPEVSTQDLQCPDLIEQPKVGDTPLGPPPGMPYIFTGTAYVDGYPAPAGELLYVKLTTSRSHPVEILEGGKYINIIHGPVSDLDRDVPFVFCLGDPEGQAVKSEEIVEYEDKGTFYEVDMELNFPMSPADLP